MESLNQTFKEIPSLSTSSISTTNGVTTILPNDTADYSAVVSISVGFAILASIICCVILGLTISNRRLHTVNHLLIGNTCVWSIFYCCAQSNHFIYLLFVPWDTSDMSCRWRGFFAYLTIAGFVYSYLLQAISRFFAIVLVHKYRRIVSFKTHYVLIVAQWIIVILLTLPAIVTKDIFFRPHSLCWVTRLYPLHTLYTLVAYYIMPITLICIIYLGVYYRAKWSTERVFKRGAQGRQQKRDMDIFRNIMILLTIYLCGGIPTTIFVFTYIDIFYSIGIVFISLTIAVEKSMTFYLNRELCDALKTWACGTKRRVVPTVY